MVDKPELSVKMLEVDKVSIVSAEVNLLVIVS